MLRFLQSVIVDVREFFFNFNSYVPGRWPSRADGIQDLHRTTGSCFSQNGFKRNPILVFPKVLKTLNTQFFATLLFCIIRKLHRLTNTKGYFLVRFH